MRQAVTYEPGRTVLEHGSPLVPGPEDVVVAVEAAGICGSDLHIFAGRHPYGRFPVVQGHELAGRVVAVGASGSACTVGERVVVEPLLSCGRCFPCRHGHDNACVRLEVLGVHRPGGFADEVLVPAQRAHPAPDLDAEVAVLCEPIAVALQAVERADIAPGDRAVVIGGGSIGRSICLAAADRGAEVLVADREPSRLRTVLQLGAVRAVHPGREDLAAAVADFTDGDGAAVVLEATGVPSVIATAFEVVAASGTVVVVGVSDAELHVPVATFTRKELTVVGSRNSAGKFPAALGLVRRHRERLQGLVSHRFPLEDTERALRLATERPDLVSKAVILPGLRPEAQS